MKKVYSTNLFYRYSITDPVKKTCTEVTESTFYERLYKYKEFKSKKYADREELKTKELTFIRFFAYLDVEDFIEVVPFEHPEEIKPKIPPVKTTIEDSLYWHNIKNNLGMKYKP